MKILILTHGCFGLELLAAARTIAGPLAGFEALCLDWRADRAEAEAEVQRAVERLLADDGELLILTDLLGSTPYNVAMPFQQTGRVAVLTGVNLPMVVRLGCQSAASSPLEETAAWLVEKGKSSICRGAAKAVSPPSVVPGPCEEAPG